MYSGPADISGKFTNVLHDGSVIVGWGVVPEPGYSPSSIFAQRIYGNYPIVPNCEITAEIMRDGNSYQLSETFLRGCPAGDLSDMLKLTFDFCDEDVYDAGEITPADIFLDTSDCPYSFCDSTFFGSTGAARNGFVVSILCMNACGCSGCQGDGCCGDTEDVPYLPVLYDGDRIGAVGGLNVKSIDVTGDGIVDLSEVSLYGETSGKEQGDPGYNSCFDFNDDGYVNLSDFGYLGAHYQHSCPSLSGSPRLAGAGSSDSRVKFKINQSEEGLKSESARIGIYLEDAVDASSICLGISYDKSSLSYTGWSSDNLDSGMELTPVVSDYGDILFFAVFNLDGTNENLIELGTLDFNITGGREICDDDLALVFGDIMTGDGEISRIAGFNYEETPIVHRNFLGDNYPNPFNPTTTIEYSIREKGHVSLKIYNVSGQLLKTLVDGFQEPSNGTVKVKWNGLSDSGESVSSGVYFYKLVSGNYSKTKKMVLLK